MRLRSGREARGRKKHQPSKKQTPRWSRRARDRAPVAADQPQHLVVPISRSITDTTLCGYPIIEAVTGEIDKTIFADGSQIWNIHRVSTFTANGKTLSSLGEFTRFFDPTQPLLVNDAGLIESVEIPGEGAVFLQAGKAILLVDASGNPVVVYVDDGPDQLISGDLAEFCAYLAS